jgi:succinate dehydrogenase/fumarate reductase flavoprotein subunit
LNELDNVKIGKVEKMQKHTKQKVARDQNITEQELEDSKRDVLTKLGNIVDNVGEIPPNSHQRIKATVTKIQNAQNTVDIEKFFKKAQAQLSRVYRTAKFLRKNSTKLRESKQEAQRVTAEAKVEAARELKQQLEAAEAAGELKQQLEAAEAAGELKQQLEAAEVAIANQKKAKAKIAIDKLINDAI